MENYTITKQQVLQLENFILKENVNKNLRIWFPNCFKKELEVGKWHKYSNSDIHLVFIEKINGTSIEGYGFDSSGWNKSTCWIIDGIIEATPQEVESALRDEAIKRGFKEGVTILRGDWYTGFGNPKEIIKKEYYYTDGFTFNDNTLYLEGYTLFKEGKWASIISEETKEITMEKAIKILSKKYGKKVEINL